MTRWQLRTPTGHGLTLIYAPTAEAAVKEFYRREKRARWENMRSWNGVGCVWYPLTRGVYAVPTQ